jgi:hypothetical protein
MPGRQNQSRFLSLIALAIWGSLILPQAFTFGQAQKRTVNLSAGKAGEVLKIPSSVWTNVNSFVFLIGFDLNGAPGAVNLEYSKRFAQMKAYPDLQAATQQWGRETFPLLQRLATELSKPDIKNLLAEMNAAFNRRKTDPRGAQQDFQQKFLALNNKFNELGQLSASVKQQFGKLDSASKAAILEYKSRNFPENKWVSIGPKLDDVQQAVGSMSSQWSALLADLQDVQRLMANNKLDDIDIEVGLLTWDDIMRYASGFITNVPAQQRYLSGDNYYDNCPLLENSYYLLKNSFLNNQDVVLAVGQDGTKLKMMSRISADNSFSQEWQFRKVGQGWWKIVNRARGDAYALDAGEMAAVGAFSGQFWRCMPTESPGWIRLVNSFNGELKSLDTYSDTWEAFMADTENRTGQYWRFVKVEPAAAR